MVEELILIGLGFALGGVLKGATGAGAPILAVPILAMLYDVPTAVALFAVPNLIPNIWQGWAFRIHRLPLRFMYGFAVSGAFGAVFGTYALANLSSEVLMLTVAVAVFAYIGFRLLRPDWSLAYRTAESIVLPIGTLAGVLQGASGISAPVSITFLNAMHLSRPQFISTISVFFAALAVVQIPLLAFYGILTTERTLISMVALLPLLAGMPVGAFLARHVSKRVFDRIVLVLLAIVATRLLIVAMV